MWASTICRIFCSAFLSHFRCFHPIISRLCELSPPCNLQRMRWNESLNDFPVTHWPLFYLRDVQHYNAPLLMWECVCICVNVNEWDLERSHLRARYSCCRRAWKALIDSCVLNEAFMGKSIKILLLKAVPPVLVTKNRNIE